MRIRTKLETSSLPLTSFDMKEKLKELEQICKRNKITSKNPFVWGNIAWLLIHFISLHYKEQEFEQYCLVMITIIFSLPCSICRNHGLSYLKENKLPREEEFFNFWIKFHNKVNRKKKKPEHKKKNMKRCIRNQCKLKIKNEKK